MATLSCTGMKPTLNVCNVLLVPFFNYETLLQTHQYHLCSKTDDAILWAALTTNIPQKPANRARLEDDVSLSSQVSHLQYVVINSVVPTRPHDVLSADCLILVWQEKKRKDYTFGGVS
jgi:hypothetical protein